MNTAVWMDIVALLLHIRHFINVLCCTVGPTNCYYNFIIRHLAILYNLEKTKLVSFTSKPPRRTFAITTPCCDSPLAEPGKAVVSNYPKLKASYVYAVSVFSLSSSAAFDDIPFLFCTAKCHIDGMRSGHSRAKFTSCSPEVRSHRTALLRCVERTVWQIRLLLFRARVSVPYDESFRTHNTRAATKRVAFNISPTPPCLLC